jgi:predicted cupin superfamily sugar epimerase
MNERVRTLIRELGLAAHPEGGWYRETFRSTASVRREADGAQRSSLTSIHFLLAAGQVSRWHRVAADEAWHHHEGGALELLSFPPDGGTLHRVALGAATGRWAHVVPANWWQAAQPLGDYALVGCTVGPGFDFADFVLLPDLPEADRPLLPTGIDRDLFARFGGVPRG